MTIKIHNPHDAIFKKFFSDIEVANSFIKAYLKKELSRSVIFLPLKLNLVLLLMKIYANNILTFFTL